MSHVINTNQGRGVSSVNGAQGAVEIGGRNLFAMSKSAVGYINKDTGNITSNVSNGETTSDYIPVDPGDVLTVQTWATANDYDANNNYYMIDYMLYSEQNAASNIGISRRYNGGVPGFNYAVIRINEIPIDAKYIRIDARLYSDGKIKVERGNVATDWTPAPEDKLDAPTNNGFRELTFNVGSDIQAGWRRVCKFRQKSFTCHNFLMFTGGNYSAIRPTTALISVVSDLYYFSAKVLNCSALGEWRKIRLVPTDIAGQCWLDIYCAAQAGAVNNRTILFVGNVDIIDVVTDSPLPLVSDAAAGAVEIEFAPSAASDAPLEGPSMADMDMDDMRQAGGYYDLYVVSVLPALIGGVRHG